MNYRIPSDVLAQYNKVQLILSRKAVREFRQRDALRQESDKRLNDDIEMVENVPDIEVSDSNGLMPMVIIEPLDSAQHPELFGVSKKNSAKRTALKPVRSNAKTPPKLKKRTPAKQTKKTPANLVRGKAKDTGKTPPAKKTPAKQTKPGRANSKKAAQPKQKPAKQGRPQFVLPQPNKKQHNKKTKGSQSKHA